MEIEALKRIEALEAELAESQADIAVLEELLRETEQDLVLATSQITLMRHDMTYSEVVQ